MSGETRYADVVRAVQRLRAREHRIAFYAWCVVGGLLMLFATKAMAAEHDASATLNIGARIVQCGTMLEATATCAREGGPCCAFANGNNGKLDEIEPDAGPKYPDIDMHGVAVEVEETDEGFTVNFE